MKAQVNSVRLVCHKSQPSYQSLTEKNSHKLFDFDNFLEALDEGEVSFDQAMLFCGNNPADEGKRNTPFLLRWKLLMRRREYMSMGSKGNVRHRRPP